MQIIDLVPDLQPVILAARQAQDARNTLAQFLPNVNVPAVSYRLGRAQRLDQTVPVRAIDAPATPIRRPGVVDVRGDLPAITPIVNLSEQDLTNDMVIARQLAGLEVDFAPAVEDAAARVALTVDNTLELMRAQLLSTGVVSLQADDGSTHAVDFGVPSGQKVTPQVDWSQGSSDPFGDLVKWHRLFILANGGPAGAIVGADGVYARLLQVMKAQFPNLPIGESALRAHLVDLRLPPFFTYDRTMRDAGGAITRLYPDDSLTFLPGPDAPIGRTELGVTQEAVQQVMAGVLRAEEAPGLTIVTLGQDNPVQRAVKAAALGMPVLRDTDSIVIASAIFGPR